MFQLNKNAAVATATKHRTIYNRQHLQSPSHVPWNAKGSLGVKEEKKVKSLCIIWDNMSIDKGMKRVT